jgi:TPR repeat protein
VDEAEVSFALRMQKFANIGHTHAQFVYGILLENGIGVQRNEKEAVRYYQSSIAGMSSRENPFQRALLSPDACQSLGVDLYMETESAVESMFSSRVKDFANLGHARAQFVYGTCLENGIGVQLNEKEAARYYQQSANQGNKDALAILEKLEVPNPELP